MRYLTMSDEDMLLEYELSLALEGKKYKQCYKCSASTYQESCPFCGIQISDDSIADEAFAKIANGEYVDLDTVLRSGEWESI